MLKRDRRGRRDKWRIERQKGEEKSNGEERRERRDKIEKRERRYRGDKMEKRENGEV